MHLNGDGDEQEGGGQSEVRPVSHHQDEALVERDLLLGPRGIRV